MTTIYYIADKDNLAIQHLNTYFQETEQSVQLISYNLVDLPKVAYLLIITPIKVNIENNDFKYCSYASIWHRWLFKNSPETVLLSAGYAEQNGHSNYIDLLSLEPDFSKYLEKAKPVADFSIRNSEENNGDYIDEWQGMTIPVQGKWISLEPNMPIRGANIIKRLKRFFDGHDASRGIEKHVTDFKQTLVGATHQLKKGDEYADVKKDMLDKFGEEEWKILYIRWIRYKYFFDYTPFRKDINRLDNDIKVLNKFMEDLPDNSNAFLSFNPYGKLDDIFNTVDQEIYGYVSEKIFCNPNN